MPKTATPQSGGRETPSAHSKLVKIDVEFVLEHLDAEQVYICGDFNDWRPTSPRMIGRPEARLREKPLVLQPRQTHGMAGYWT
jgi:hypothetical protein